MPFFPTGQYGQRYLMNLSKVSGRQLTTRFSTPRLLLAGNRLHPYFGASLTPEVVVGRDHCHYFSANLGHVPASQRKQALQHLVEGQCPWRWPGHAVVWQDGVAQVWVWDQTDLEAALAAQSAVAPGALWRGAAICLPESVYYSKPAQDGMRLQRCQQGYELQYWQEQCLLASRWYACEPTAAEVLWFARSQAIAASVSRPTPVDAQPQALPWPGARPPVWHWLFARRKSALVVATAAAVLLVSLQLTAGLRWSVLAQDYQRQTQALEQSATEVLHARGEARRARHRHEELYRLFAQPDPLSAQLLVTQRMPAGLEYEIVFWERSHRTVEMVIKAELTDTFGIVRALSGTGITNVRVEPWRLAGHHSIKEKTSNYWRDISIMGKCCCYFICSRNLVRDE